MIGFVLGALTVLLIIGWFIIRSVFGHVFGHVIVAAAMQRRRKRRAERAKDNPS